MQELIDLERQHPELVTPDSPTQRVGGDVQTELKSVRHAVPMMSIDNTYSEEEIRAFDERVRKGLGGEQPAYVLEPKIDGTSISLRYENGQLVLAATRGRGNVGDDVTVNARTIKSIPLTLHKDGATVPPPPILEVRGEVYMDNEDFQRVNKEIEAEGEEPYANARNLTSGTLRRLDPKIVAKRRLRVSRPRRSARSSRMPAESYWEWTQLLRDWGLPLPQEVVQAANIDEVIARIHEFEKIRPKLPYMTDGMVVKVDSLRPARAPGRDEQGPAVGHRLQVRNRAAADGAQERPLAGRQRRQPHAGRRAGARLHRRRDGDQRHAAQHRPDQAARSAPRRHGHHRAGRRGDSVCRRGGAGEAAQRGQADRAADEVPVVRRRRSSRRPTRPTSAA